MSGILRHNSKLSPFLGVSGVGQRGFVWLSFSKNYILYINYLCTYDLYSLVHKVLDACISITRASGRGLGPGIGEFWALWNGIKPIGECNSGIPLLLYSWYNKRTLSMYWGFLEYLPIWMYSSLQESRKKTRLLALPSQTLRVAKAGFLMHASKGNLLPSYKIYYLKGQCHKMVFKISFP